jgi:hypothetical protein
MTIAREPSVKVPPVGDGEHVNAYLEQYGNEAVPV